MADNRDDRLTRDYRNLRREGHPARVALTMARDARYWDDIYLYGIEDEERGLWFRADWEWDDHGRDDDMEPAELSDLRHYASRSLGMARGPAYLHALELAAKDEERTREDATFPVGVIVYAYASEEDMDADDDYPRGGGAVDSASLWGVDVRDPDTCPREDDAYLGEVARELVWEIQAARDEETGRKIAAWCGLPESVRSQVLAWQEEEQEEDSPSVPNLQPA